MAIPWDMECSWVPTWRCPLVSCISVRQLLSFSQDTQHLQIGWAAQIISCDWESCWGLAAASEELLVGKVGLHTCPVSLPLKASQKHPEELLKTHPHRAETAWPLFVLAGSSLSCLSVPVASAQGEANLSAYNIITATSACVRAPVGLRKSTQVSELPPSAQRVNPFSLLYFHL